MSELTLKQKAFLAEALRIACLSGDDYKDFTLAAAILRKVGMPRHAEFLESRRDLMRKVKQVSFAEIAKRPNSSKFLVAER